MADQGPALALPGMATQDSESAQRWMSERCKAVSVTLEGLSKGVVPKLAANRIGYGLLLSSVDPSWPIPHSLRKKLELAELDGAHHNNITCSVSLALYHAPSKRFFGSTHAGYSHPFAIKSSRTVPAGNVNELVYFHSRLDDPNVFVVVELVTSILSPLDGSVSSRYGCGWALIPLQDDGQRRIDSTGRVALYGGSPRDLLQLQLKGSGFSAVLRHLEAKRTPGMLSYNLSRSNGLGDALSSCLSEHQIVGASTPVAGLRTTTIHYLDNRASVVDTPCVGAFTKGNALDWTLLPPMDCPAILASPTALEASHITVELPHRLEMEMKLVAWFAAAVPKGKGRLIGKLFRWNKLSPSTKGECIPVTTVSRRKLRIGVHNGHVILDNQWHEVELHCDDSEPDRLRAQNDLTISTYVDHPSCALLCALEYELVTTHTTRGLQSPKKETTSTSTVVVGVGVHCSVELARMNEASEQSAALQLFNDSQCQSLCPNLLFTPAQDDAAEPQVLSFGLRPFDASKTRTLEEPDRSDQVTNEAKESDSDAASLDRAAKSSFLRINAGKQSEAKSDCSYVSRMGGEASVGETSAITDASPRRLVKSPVNRPVFTVNDVSRASYEYSASVEMSDENTETSIEVTLHSFTIPSGQRGPLQTALKFRFKLYTFDEVSTGLLPLRGTAFVQPSSFAFGYDFASVDSPEELATFLMERDLVVEVLGDNARIVGTLLLPLHLFLRQGKARRRLENLSVDVICGESFVGSIVLSIQCLGGTADKPQDTSVTQRPAGKHVVAKCLLASCTEVRRMANELRVCCGESRREDGQTARGGDDNLRHQQLEAVAEFRRQRQREGDRAPTDALDSFFHEVTNLSSGHDDVEARVLNAVQWAREGKKNQIIAEHVQKYRDGLSSVD